MDALQLEESIVYRAIGRVENDFDEPAAPYQIGILLAVSAGALVYVGASHLLPAVERENKKYSILALAAGVLVAVFIVMSKG